MLSALFAAATGAPAASLKEAIEYGLSHSAKVKGAEATRQSASLSRETAERAFLPNLDSSISTSAGGSNKDPGELKVPVYASSAELKLSQTIWDGGIRSLEADAARNADAVAAMNLQEARDQFIFELVSKYFEYSEAVVNLKSQEDQQKILERQERESNDAFRQGMRTKRDHMRLQAGVRRNELTLIASRDAMVNSVERLRLFIGSNPAEALTFEPISILEMVEKKVNAIAATPIEKTLPYQREVLLNQLDDINLAAERRRNIWPSVNLSAASGYQTQNFIGPGAEPIHGSDGLYWNASLGFKYTIWDWGTKNRNMMKIVLDQTVSKTSRALAMEELKLKLATNLRGLNQAVSSYKLNRDLLALEEESFSTIQRDFRQGLASYLEIVDATEKLQTSRVGVFQSYYGFQRLLWERHLYEGKIYEAYLAL
ncbi:MAG: TolC family protein [Proteobacteria bacterium]|nr:TolC family protein [Pseudomonadota bacterium]